MTPSPQEVTPLLIDCRNGNKTALNQLMPLVSDVGAIRNHHQARVAESQPGCIAS
jgi:hypothetical protein